MKRALALFAVTVLAGVTLVASAGAESTWCGGRGKILILGDSASTGYGTTGYSIEESYRYQDTAWGWVSRLDDKADTEIVNLAINGAMVSDFLTDGVEGREEGPFEPYAVLRVKDEKPDLVIIELGGNEYVTDRDPIGVYQANLESLRDRVKWAASGARIMFVHTHHFDYRSVPNPQHTWNQYAAAMKTVASGHLYLDLSPYLPSARYNSGLYIEDEYGPGLAVHANDQGHSAYFAAIWGAMQC